MNRQITRQTENNEALIQTLQSSLTSNYEAITNFITSFGEKLDSMIDNTQVAITTQIGILSKGQLERTNEVITGILAQLSSSTQDMLSKHSETMQQILDSQANKFDELLTAQQNFVLSLNTENSTLKEHLGALVEGLEKQVDTQCEALAEAIRQNVNVLDASFSFIDSRIGTIKMDFDLATDSFREAMQLAITDNENGFALADQMQQALESMRKSNEQMDKLVKHLEANQSNHEDLLQRMREMKSSIVEIEESVYGTQKRA